MQTRALVKFVALSSLLASSALAHASSPLDFNFTADPGDNYKKLVKPIVTPMRFMFVNSARGAAVFGFEAGLVGSAFQVPSETQNLAKIYLRDGSDLPDYLGYPRVVAQVDLPFGLSVAGNYAPIPQSKANLWGAGGQYQIDLPAPVLPLYAAARVGYTTLTGLSELEASNLNFEALASAGMPAGINLLIDIEPWVGFGLNFSKAKSDIEFSPGAGLPTVSKNLDHDWEESYAMLGAKLSIAFFKLGAEAQFSLSGNPTVYNLKAAFGI